MSNLNHTQKLERELATERKACEAFAELNRELEAKLKEETAEKWANQHAAQKEFRKREALEAENHRLKDDRDDWHGRYMALYEGSELQALREALQAAVDCGMVPTTSAADGGAAKHSEQVRVADLIRAALKEVGK